MPASGARGRPRVILKQDSGWTYGALANHLWSFAGDDKRSDVSSTFLQPFLSYTTPTALTFAFNTESTYDWNARQWSVPLNALVSQVTKFGDQLVSVGGGLRSGPRVRRAGHTAWASGSSWRCCSPK